MHRFGALAEIARFLNTSKRVAFGIAVGVAMLVFAFGFYFGKPG